MNHQTIDTADRCFVVEVFMEDGRVGSTRVIQESDPQIFRVEDWTWLRCCYLDVGIVWRCSMIDSESGKPKTQSIVIFTRIVICINGSLGLYVGAIFITPLIS